MIDFNNRQLFTPFTHPESGVTFYILTRKVAPVQQGFDKAKAWTCRAD